MRLIAAILLLGSLFPAVAAAQCAPAPDSAYFFRNLSEQRAEAKIADNRTFYDTLLSERFALKSQDGKALAKGEFIDAELAAGRKATRRPFFSIREYTLVEHRKGYAVANYLLIEGTTGDGETRAVETWLREAYEVEDGQWRLTDVEIEPAPQR